MAYNMEIKAIYRGDFKNARQVATMLGASHHGLDRQIDIYFKTINGGGRFKLRESSLSGFYLVPYIRPNQQSAKESDYVLIRVDKKDVEKSKALFAQLYGIETVVKKMRDIYLYQNVRIHLDDVEGLGCFFELEVVYEENNAENRAQAVTMVNFLMNQFGIEQKDLLSGSYHEMMQ